MACSITPRGGEAERFDEVVLATHSDQALRMLADATDREHEILGAIPYQPNEAVLHTDRATAAAPPPRVGELELPPAPGADRADHGDLPHEPPAGARRRPRVLRDAQPFRSDRSGEGPAHDPYAHPVFTPEGARAQARHEEISGRNRTHYAGAYWRWGFHEDGVVSALRVGERFGARL